MSPTPLADHHQPDPDPEVPSAQDLYDAEDILFAHPPRQVARLVCHCGDDYPCDEVRFAMVIKDAT